LFQLKINYDIASWVNVFNDKPLSDFSFPKPTNVLFFHSTENKRILRDGLKRYETDNPGMVKLVQRLAGATPKRSVSIAS